MKFIHVSDVHLGAKPDKGKPWSEDRIREIKESFDNVIEKANEENIDILLIAGDLFHKSPLVRELKEVNYLFSKLKKAKVVIIAGNHDYIGYQSKYADFDWNDNVYMLLSEDISSIYFEDINTEVYGLSYYKRDIYEPLYDNVQPDNSSRINILLAHGGDERNIPINRNTLKNAGFDYIALGHIHKPEIISSNMAYSGSLEPLDKNETGDRGYIMGEIIDKEVTLQFIKSCKRSYHHIDIISDTNMTNSKLIEEIRAKQKDMGINDIYKITIKGIRSSDINFNLEDIERLNNIVEAEDKTMPDYNFDELYKDNKNNIIGMYIEALKNENEDTDIIQKALYYGLDAMLYQE